MMNLERVEEGNQVNENAVKVKRKSSHRSCQLPWTMFHTLPLP